MNRANRPRLSRISGSSYASKLLGRAGDGSTLTLDFTTGQLDPRLTFTRASTVATFINASGLVATAATNAPRFDYDPTTLAPKGLLIEGTATNLFNWSETFDTTGGATNWNWSVNVTRGTVTTTNPTGASATVIKIEETTTNGIHAPLTVLAVLASTAYTFSVWAKAVERTFVQLFENGGSGATSMVNLSTGAVVSESTAGITTVTALGTTGWYRIAMRLTTIVGQTTANCQLRLSTNGTTTSYAGTTGSGIYIWGAQLEQGSGASSYIPTGASTVTRVQDEVVLSNLSGISFNQSAGTVYSQVEIVEKLRGSFVPYGSFDTSGGGRCWWWLRHNHDTSVGQRILGTAFNAGGSTAIASSNYTHSSGVFKFATSLDTSVSRMVYAIAGGSPQVTTASAFTLATAAQMSLNKNNDVAATDLGSMWVRTIKYWPTALSDAQLQATTT